MKEYYKVIDNKWGDECPCFALDELAEAIEYAKIAQDSATRNNILDHEDKPFKVVILLITSQIISF